MVISIAVLICVIFLFFITIIYMNFIYSFIRRQGFKNKYTTAEKLNIITCYRSHYYILIYYHFRVTPIIIRAVKITTYTRLYA